MLFFAPPIFLTVSYKFLIYLLQLCAHFGHNSSVVFIVVGQSVFGDVGSLDRNFVPIHEKQIFNDFGDETVFLFRRKRRKFGFLGSLREFETRVPESRSCALRRSRRGRHVPLRISYSPSFKPQITLLVIIVPDQLTLRCRLPSRSLRHCDNLKQKREDVQLSGASLLVERRYFGIFVFLSTKFESRTRNFFEVMKNVDFRSNFGKNTNKQWTDYLKVCFEWFQGKKKTYWAAGR